jgi:hypothetical protein
MIRPLPWRRALVVGIDAYPPPYTLAGCVNDAIAWADVLTRKRFHVERLLDREATHDAIVSALATLLSQGHEGDHVAKLYSGHGTQLRDLDGDEADRWDEALVPVDALETGAFLIDDTLRQLTQSAPYNVGLTVFADSCFSSSITRVFGPNVHPSAARARYIPSSITMLSHQAARASRPLSQRLIRPGARQVVQAEDLRSVSFSACLATEVAYERDADGVTHGDFTRAAVAVLANAGGTMTRAGFIRRVIAAMGPQRNQTPTLDCADGVERRTLWKTTEP